MSPESYLLFELNYSCYGIPTSAIQELFFLPEITPVSEAPSFIVGVVNLRGHILPIVDLHQRLGKAPRPYQLTNSIIVLQWQTQRVGLLVDQIYAVQTIANSQIQSNLVYEQWQASEFQRFVTGIASIDTTLVTLLSPEQLLRSSPAEHDQCEQYGSQPEAMLESKFSSLFAHLSSDAQQILRSRANHLREAIETQDTIGIPVTVVGLNGEYFGLSLEAIHEFTDIRKVAPVPCCPPHILGNMNLRGEVITLVDISQAIHLPSNSLKSRKKAIVVRSEAIVAGIAVDEILDVVYLAHAQILATPVALHSTSDDYLQGVVPYQDKMIGIINLSKILTSGALVVDEEV